MVLNWLAQAHSCKITSPTAARKYEFVFSFFFFNLGANLGVKETFPEGVLSSKGKAICAPPQISWLAHHN